MNRDTLLRNTYSNAYKFKFQNPSFKYFAIYPHANTIILHLCHKIKYYQGCVLAESHAHKNDQLANCLHYVV